MFFDQKKGQVSEFQENEFVGNRYVIYDDYREGVSFHEDISFSNEVSFDSSNTFQTDMSFQEGIAY